MVTRFRAKLTFSLTLAVVLALLLAQLAFADQVVNNIDTTIDPALESRMVTLGNTTSVGFFIRAITTSGDANGCNATGSEPATVTINNPAAVNASTNSLTFTGCGIVQSVTYSPTTVGSYTISIAGVTGGKAGSSWDTAPASFTLIVNPPPDSTPPDTSITANPPDPSNSSSASFSFTGTDDVTPAGSITFECQLDGGGFGACSSSKSYSSLSDGSHTFQVRAKDAANNVDPTPASFIWIVDTVAPTITFVGPSTASWYNADVTASWSCSDASGVLNASVTATTSVEGNAQDATGTCTDNAGNTASDTQSFMVDKTGPSVSATPNPPANANGWNNTDVTVSYDCTDGLSGVNAAASDLADDVLTASGTASGTCVDMAGNSANASYDAQIDKVKPVITGSRTPAANANGWNNTDVVVSFSCTDSGGSGIDTVTVAGATVSTEGEGQSVINTGSCTDKAGNTADPATVNGINIDRTAPSASASASPAANSNGWNNTDVTVSFSGSDGLSDIDFCDADVVLSGEGAGQSASGTCTDNAGNVSAPATASGINIDKTAPTSISFVAGPAAGGSYYFGSVPAAPTCTADGAISGLASCTVSGYGTTVGAHTMTATATDNAGNAGTSTQSYTVLAWALTGFFQPVDMNNVVNTVKGGSTVPLKFEVFAGSTELTATSVVKLFVQTKIACDTSASIDEIEVTTTGGTSLRYDTTAGQFVQNWQTPKQAGACYRVTMTSQDGSSIAAFFKLK